MTVQAKRIRGVEGLGDIFQVALPLDKQIKAFKDVGIVFPYLVDPREVVEIRLAGVSNGFTRTSLMPVTVKGKPTILARPSDLMTPYSSAEAVRVHRDGKYPTRSRDFYEVVKRVAQFQEGDEPEDRTAIVVSKKGDHSWTPEMPETRFTLGRRAKEYFKAEGHEKIYYYDLEGDSKNHSTVNYTWFGSPQGGSSLYCGDRGLYYDGTSFVVQKFGYVSLTDVRNANLRGVARFLEEKGLTGLKDNLTGLDETVITELFSWA